MYSATYIWSKIIGDLERKLSEITVSAWLDDAELVELNDEQLIVYSPSDFRQEIIRERCGPYIQEALQDLFHLKAKLVVWGDSELHNYREKKKEIDPVFFNPQFTFDSFVTGESNQIAVKIAQAAATNPGSEVYNPLFIYGPPGVGKTHLQYAVANHIRQLHPDLNVVYIRGDQFTNELVNAIKNGKTAEFKNKYRHDVDVLLIDDIQFIAGKESTQEEFFHTFNQLYECKKQILMTADRKPGDMVTLEDRLRGRFGEGIMVGISVPDPDTRISIIRAKAKKLLLDFDEETIHYLADNLTDNVRQIEGALKKVRAYRDLGALDLTLVNVARTIEDICTGDSKMPITSSIIIRNVARYYGTDEDSLKGPQKSKGVAEPRQIAMYLIRKLVKMSYSDIGKEFGGRDHGTVHHSVKKVEATLKLKDNRLDGVIQDITSNIENTIS